MPDRSVPRETLKLKSPSPPVLIGDSALSRRPFSDHQGLSHWPRRLRSPEVCCCFMILNFSKIGRYFYLVSNIGIHQFPLPKGKISSKAVLRPGPNIHRQGFYESVVLNTGFGTTVHRADMSILESRQGFHSSTDVSSIHFNEQSEIQDPKSTCQDHTCSPSVQSTPDIEKKFVHHVYDAIAPHFSSTRYAKWPKVAEFLNSLRSGSVILDAGCGNGKYLGFNPNCFYIGCDISPPLIDICASRGHEVMVADAVNLPYRTNFGDASVSIAVLHHLSTEIRRRKAIEELVRVVRKGGLVLITVWAVEQEDRSLLKKWTPLCNKYDEEWIRPSSPRVHNPSPVVLESISETNEDCYLHGNQSKQTHDQLRDADEQSNENISVTATTSVVKLEGSASSTDGKTADHQEYFVPWHLPYHRAEIGGASASSLANGLAKKDDKKSALVYNRYYHVFIKGELERLVSDMDNAAIVEQFYDKSNWCIVLEKI